MRAREAGDGDTREDPWDFFHINSIDKDGRGNYLVSSRYMSCLAYIDGQTGDVLWKLGGTENSFRDLSAGAATNISWQHHARFQIQFDTNFTRSISLFDNGSRGEGAPEHVSRGLLVEIDEDAMTAAVAAEYWNPHPISSQSQGSMQVLGNGHVLVGYGYGAAWTEFTPEGEALCETHFGPMTQFHRGQVMSYRVFKQEWVGRPLTSPSVALSGTEAAVSWNGATEVVTWVLQGASPRGVETGDDERGSAGAVREVRNNEDDVVEFEFISAVPKTGFETIIPIPRGVAYSKLKIVALDKTGSFLRATEPLDWEPEDMDIEIAVYNGEEDNAEDTDTKQGETPFASTVGIGLIIVAVLGLCIWFACKLAEGGSLKDMFAPESNEQAWRKVHAAEELDDLDGLSDCESGDGASDVLLKPSER